MKFFSYLACLSSLIGLAFAVIAWRLDRGSRLNRAFAASGVFYAVWTGCLTMVYGATNLQTAFLFYQIGYLGVFGLNVALGAIFLELSEVPVRWQRIIIGVGAVGALTIAAGYLTFGFPWLSVQPGDWGNTGMVAGDNPWSTASDVFFIGLDLVYMILIGRAALNPENSRRRHYVRLATAAVVGSLPLYALLGWAAQRWNLPAMTFLPGLGVQALLLYDTLQLRTMQPRTPAFGEALSASWSVPTLLLDQKRVVVGANHAARERWAGITLTGRSLEELFDEQERSSLLVNQSFDQWGDFVGFVVTTPASSRSWPESLSEREGEVLERVLRGLGNKDIAEELYVSEGTIKTHVHSILKKTGCDSREQLFRRWSGGLA